MRPSVERVRALLDYDPETGVFIWKPRPSPQWTARYAGTVAGNVRADGYMDISIDNSRMKASRLAWAYTHGAWPSKQIDHINGVRLDNRISNLREADWHENGQNISIQRNNTSGFLGVTYNTHAKSFVAQITVDRKTIYLGHFNETRGCGKSLRFGKGKIPRVPAD